MRALLLLRCDASTSLSRGTTPGTDYRLRLCGGFRKGHHHKREHPRSRGVLVLRRRQRALKDDFDDEEKFVPIDYDSENCPGETAEGRFGPDAILLVGFTPTEKRVVREMLNDMGADFIDLITCTKEMYEKMTLKECMHSSTIKVPGDPGFRSNRIESNRIESNRIESNHRINHICTRCMHACMHAP